MEKLSTIEYRTISQIAGPLIFVKGVANPVYGSLVEIVFEDEEPRAGQIIDASEDVVAIQVFEETMGLDLEKTKVKFVEQGLRLDVSPEILGRVFNGRGQPIDGLPEIMTEESVSITGSAINPYSRDVPSDFIQTGISTIDGLNTLVRGQKLPIFSLAGLPANKLASQQDRQSHPKSLPVFFGRWQLHAGS